jgi:prepilin-type N-terminal cleavage/methylation domain-containing protein
MRHVTRGPVGRGGFTLIELITVIAVMAVLIAIGIPAFNAALASSDKALSESQFRIGIESARQVAIQNSSRDAAAVFVFEPGGRMSIVPCVYVGTLLDWADPSQTGAGDKVVERDVFVPVPEIAPVQLPRGWMARGFAPPGSIHSQQNPTGWYEPTNDREFEAGNGAPAGNWVFPENAFFRNIRLTGTSGDYSLEGHERQTFLVRFKAGSGQVDASESRLCLVIDPAPSEVIDANGASVTWRGTVGMFEEIVKAPDLQRYVRQLLAKPDVDRSGGADQQDDEARRALIGDESSDSILARPVTELALYREQSLASALGARGVNRVTGSLYGDATGVPQEPKIDFTLFPGGISASEVAQNTNLWITGKLRVGTEFVESDAKVFAMDRYLGQGRKLGDDREVTP